ncbi:MAG: peptidase domain protein [Myxococcales bacterium]|nr:peptidase domain protein [Myxococcales bacterium]
MTYRVSLDERALHRATVEMTVTGAPASLELWMPAWTPGAYELRSWGRNVTPLDASDGNGRPLRFARTDASHFRVDGGAGGIVKLRYRVYAAQLTDDGSHIDGGHALLNGSSLFLAVHGQELGLHEVRVLLPPGWRAATALEEDAGGWQTTSFEALIDAPIECGRFADATAHAAGRTYRIAVDGAAAVPQRFVDDVAKLADAEAHLAGAPPYRRYVVLIHLSDEIGRVAALEHAASTSILVPRRSLTDADAYDELVYVVAHELFHAWNARRLRPAELIPYDLLHVQPSRALWITEGLTEYFAHRAMLRSGRWTRATYLAHVGDEAQRAVIASRHGGSVEDAAAATWQPPDDAEEDLDAYYARGHLVALAVDAAIHVATDGSHGLAEVLRAQLGAADAAGGVLPVDTDRLARAIDTVAPGVGAKLIAWARTSDETTLLSDSLSAIGLKLDVAIAPPRTVAGFAAEREGALLRVSAIADGGPASLAGLKPGDKITHFDGALPPPRWPELIVKKPAGATLTLTVLRGARPLELHLTLAAERDVVCKLVPTPATPAVTKLRDAFLTP